MDHSVSFDSHWELTEYIRDKLTYCEPSTYPIDRLTTDEGKSTSIRECDPEHDRAYFEKGIERRRSIHFVSGSAEGWLKVIKATTETP
jgi:hypothetical protein